MIGMTGTAVCIVFVVLFVKVELKWISPGPRHLWTHQLLFDLQLSTSGIILGNVTSSGLNSSLPQTKFNLLPNPHRFLFSWGRTPNVQEYHLEALLRSGS